MVFHYLFLNNIRKSTIISFYVGFLCFRVLICKGLRPSTLMGGILLIFESPQWKGDPSGPTSNACSHADIVPCASHPHLASLSLQTHWTHTCLMTKPWVCCPTPMLCPQEPQGYHPTYAFCIPTARQVLWAPAPGKLSSHFPFTHGTAPTGALPAQAAFPYRPPDLLQKLPGPPSCSHHTPGTHQAHPCHPGHITIYSWEWLSR